jgi:hypothetical protein
LRLSGKIVLQSKKRRTKRKELTRCRSRPNPYWCLLHY